MFSCFLLFAAADLRDDQQFVVDHPGAVPISTAQVHIYTLLVLFFFFFFFSENMFHLFKVLILHCFFLKGEELRKQIGSPAYVECSSKTQQVNYSLHILHIFLTEELC